MKQTILNYAKVAYAFLSLNVVLFIAFCRNVVLMMTGNAAFATPSPTLAALTVELDKLEAMTQAAVNRDRLAIANRNAQRAVVAAMMRQLGSYVETTSAGDLPTLLSSGFEAWKTRTTAGQLPAPGDLRLTLTGNSGEALAKWNSLSNCASYLVQVATEPDGDFISQMPCTAARLVLTGLEPLKPIWVRVCGNGSAGAGLWSNVITITVL